MLHEAKAKGFQSIVDFVQADAIAIPLLHNCIDLAICDSVFSHFNNKAKVLREITRVLKSNGQLVIHTASRDAINQLHQSIGGVVVTFYLMKTIFSYG